MYENTWYKEEEQWYYLKAGGYMARNELLKIGNEKFAFLDSGRMVRTNARGALKKRKKTVTGNGLKYISCDCFFMEMKFLYNFYKFIIKIFCLGLFPEKSFSRFTVGETQCANFLFCRLFISKIDFFCLIA